MRTIKFRAYHDEGKQMTDVLFHDMEIMLEDSKWHIMQFIGLKDKNGKEVYEGDIIYKKTDEANLDYEERPTEWLHVIKWNNENASWGVWEQYIDKDDEGLGPMYAEDWEPDFVGFEYEKIEVIGNIYESDKLSQD